MPTVYNIGPGALHTPDSPFILSKPEWLTVQCYVASALHLPINQESMRDKLPADPPGGMEQFEDLWSAYKVLNDHCQFWKDHTFEDSVNCANDIVHYNQKVPSYYGALNKLLLKLEQAPPDPTAVKAILKNLSQEAKVYADHAELVRQAMENFTKQTEEDQQAINGLMDKYQEKIGAESPEIIKLSEQLAADKAEIKKWDDEYWSDVVKAATTPTYGWIWPFGTIAATVVAGVYGKKATDALKKKHAYEKARDLLSNELKAAHDLMADLTRIQIDLKDISSKLNTALPVIQKIQGIWTAIHSDLENILRIIDEDIDQVVAIIKFLGIDEAIQAWDMVAKEADAYRVNAYIYVTTEEEAKKEGEKLKKVA